ncbi:hypothetical protein AB3N04_11640 [Alkalihalophilus sp. As8PL]|uniref:Uncharacterized protein n=1 Tax=Alkalihalophilus sp. As8PL TaxID=3237103 RepID=A0AB39BNR3_9BACI
MQNSGKGYLKDMMAMLDYAVKLTKQPTSITKENTELLKEKGCSG